MWGVSSPGSVERAFPTKGQREGVAMGERIKPRTRGGEGTDTITPDHHRLLAGVGKRLEGLGHDLAELGSLLAGVPAPKEGYSRAELGSARGVSQYTVQERWCNGGRIEAEKDAVTGRWRIPGREFRRLVQGGGLKVKRG